MSQTLTYDLVLLLDAAAEEEQRKKILADVKQLLAANGATIAQAHEWGTRRTAFEIEHKTAAEYHLLQFEGGPKVPAELDRVLSITDGISRHRVIRTAKRAPAPADLSQAPAPEAEAPEPAPERL
jgi:small subunit ribosomal protein S6